MEVLGILKKFQIELSASTIFGGPSYEVQHEMKKIGWKFDNYSAELCSASVGKAFFSNINVVIAKNPEGLSVTENKEVAKKYRETRYKIAQEIYGMS